MKRSIQLKFNQLKVITIAWIIAALVITLYDYLVLRTNNSLGPSASYLINADLKTSAGVLGYNVFNNSLDATDQFNRWDMGVTGGIGFQLSNGINLSASYDHGLSKSDANKNISSYNHAFKIGIGIRF